MRKEANGSHWRFPNLQRNNVCENLAGMALPEKPLDQITEADLQLLVQNAEQEKKTLEYKRQLPSQSDADKKEFVYDVASFANASGGHILYGIEAQDGVPTTICGIGTITLDAEILRLNSMLRAGIKPPIPGVDIQGAPLQSGSCVIIIRVPRSWTGPHWAGPTGSEKFYFRTSAGKSPMDISEIRAAFLLSETAADKVRSFRADRLANVISNEPPYATEFTAKIVLHLLPIASFSSGFQIDLRKLDPPRTAFRPMAVFRGYAHCYNFDGYMCYERGHTNTGKNYAYTQVFRNGCIEAVDCSILSALGGRKTIKKNYEPAVANYLKELIKILEWVAVDPPYVVALSLIGVRDYRMEVGEHLLFSGNWNPIDRDNLILSEIIAETRDVDAPKLLKRAFDSVWNACGFPQSLNYDKGGNWPTDA